MKQRLITAFFGLAFLAVVLFLFHTPVFNIAIACLCAIAMYEMLDVTGLNRRIYFLIVSLLFGATPAIIALFEHNVSPAGIFMVYFMMLMIGVLKNHETVQVEKVALLFMVGAAATFSFTTLVSMRNTFGANGLFYFCISLGGAWFYDAGGYFVGRFFGKHKLSPKVSPKKTVEGAIGGIVLAVPLMVITALVYRAIFEGMGQTISINWLLLCIVSVLLSVAGMLGDLCASVIKRQNQIKDFGKIFPGHGGILDRFDSVLFTVPITFAFALYFPIIG